MRRDISSTRPSGRFLLSVCLACSLAVPAAAQSSASISIDPGCGPEATGQPEEGPYEILVQGTGFEPNDDVEITFAGERQDDPQQEDVVADGNGRFSVIVRPARRPAGTYEVEAVQRTGDGSVSYRAPASFSVPCPDTEPTAEPTTEPTTPASPQATLPPEPPLPTDPGDKKDKRRPGTFEPSLRLDAAVGPPGSVIEARGSGFPPRARLVLKWDEGIGSIRVQTDGRGRFTAGVLVFPNDEVGRRRLVVTGRRVPRSQIGFLVVPSTAAPPDFVR